MSNFYNASTMTATVDIMNVRKKLIVNGPIIPSITAGGKINFQGDVSFSGNVQAAAMTVGSIPIWLGQSDFVNNLFVADKPGYYKLKEPVVGSFSTEQEGVVFDMSSLTLTYGGNAALVGVQSTGNKFSLWDGTIKGFEQGVYVSGSNGVVCNNITVLDTTVPLVRRPNAHAAAEKKIVVPEYTVVVPNDRMHNPPPVAAKTARAVPAGLKHADQPRKTFTPSATLAAAKAATLVAKEAKTLQHRAKLPKVTQRAKPARKHAKDPAVIDAHKDKKPHTARSAHHAKQHYLPSDPSLNRRAQTAARRSVGLKPKIVPHCVSESAISVRIESCNNVVLQNINVRNSSEVCVSLVDCSGFTVSNITMTGSSRGLSLSNCASGQVCGINAYSNYNISSYEFAGTVEVIDCYDVKMSNLSLNANVKAYYSNAFDGNAGILTLVGNDNVTIDGCFLNENTQEVNDSYSTLQPLLILGNQDVTIRNCHINGNWIDNDGLDGGYLYLYSLLFNLNVTFYDCTSDLNYVYNGNSGELISWLVVPNYNVKCVRCTTNMNEVDTNGGGCGGGGDAFGWLVMDTYGFQSVDCQINEMSVNNGYMTAMALWDGSDGASITGLQINDCYAYDNCKGIEIDSTCNVVIDRLHCGELYSDNQDVYNILFSGCDGVIKNCVINNSYAWGASYGIMLDYAQDCCVEHNVVGSMGGEYDGFGIMVVNDSYHNTFSDNKVVNCYSVGYFDAVDPWNANNWFGNEAQDNDTNYIIYSDQNIAYYYANNSNPWSSVLTINRWMNISISID